MTAFSAAHARSFSAPHPLKSLFRFTRTSSSYLYLVSWIRLAIRRVSESWFFWGLASPQKKAAGDEFVCTLNL